MIKLKSIGIIFLIIIGGILLKSCSSNDELNEQTEKTFTIKFENNIRNKKSKNEKKISPEYTTYEVKINSKGRPIVDNDKLIVVEVVNKETLVKSYAIYEKDNYSSFSLKSLQLSMKANGENNGNDCPSVKRGYWYDGYDCFIYGTIVTDDNCETLFIPADVATQYLLNNCGWSNVA